MVLTDILNKNKVYEGTQTEVAEMQFVFLISLNHSVSMNLKVVMALFIKCEKKKCIKNGCEI